MNRLTQALTNICRDELLAEKWLLAPSRRVGHQWLESVAREGQAAVNVRIKTLRSLAADLAAPELARRGLTLVTPTIAVLLVGRVLCRLQGDRLQYLSGLPASVSLAEVVQSTISAIRLCGLSVEHLAGAEFEASAKGADLGLILQEYLAELASGAWVDQAEVLRIAIARLESEPDCLGEDIIILAPADLRLAQLEEQLLAALPEGRKRSLPVDEPAVDSGEAEVTSDLELLRWVQATTAAPAAGADGSVKVVQAVGEVNEIRAVFRHCLAEGIPFDQVELLHTDRDTYVPLVYDVLTSNGPETETRLNDLPVTFAEGRSCADSRPGRAFSFWLHWIRGGFPQAALVSAIREGLLVVLPPEEAEAPSFQALATALGQLPIGQGRERYGAKIAELTASLELRSQRLPQSADEEEESLKQRVQATERQLKAARGLEVLLKGLLEASPTPEAAPPSVLAAAIGFLRSWARRVNKIDEAANLALIEQIEALAGCITEEDAAGGLDVWEWLAALPRELRVLGLGPRPGCLHVDSIYSGGHSGRQYTFIVGLDDGRFPGAGLQDPLLLDNERRGLSSAMPTAAGRQAEMLDDFARLLARLRGRVTLGFCCRSIVDDREMFASPVVLDVFRLLDGRPDADQSDLAQWLEAPHSFAPTTPEQSLSTAEWWLGRLCGPEASPDQRESVLRHFPHLGQGAEAALQRAAPEFTAYDGKVEAAGRDLDPTAAAGRVLSANSLQTMGCCPRRFFFKYALDLALPEGGEVDPLVWLNPLALGSLLHEFFEEFIRELAPADDAPSFERHQARLLELLDESICRYRDRYVPANESAFRRQQRELRRVAETFLREEERYAAKHNARPLYLEASLGMQPVGSPTEIDTEDPVPIPLSDGRTVPVRGRIDRINRLGAADEFDIWDYKTGSTYGYNRAEPFREGRLMQPYLYVVMVGHRLREAVSAQALISRFGFFFPGTRAAGQRIAWTPEDLGAGQQILDQLCAGIANGAFIATNDSGVDCTYCDYRLICGDVDLVSAQSQQMLDHPENESLAPMRALRISDDRVGTVGASD